MARSYRKAMRRHPFWEATPDSGLLPSRVRVARYREAALSNASSSAGLVGAHG